MKEIKKDPPEVFLTAYSKNPYNGKMMNMLPLMEELHEQHGDDTKSMAEELLEITKHISYSMPDESDSFKMANIFYFLYSLRDIFLKMGDENDESVAPIEKKFKSMQPFSLMHEKPCADKLQGFKFSVHTRLRICPVFRSKAQIIRG